jgi:hypothetical protein
LVGIFPRFSKELGANPRKVSPNGKREITLAVFKRVCKSKGFDVKAAKNLEIQYNNKGRVKRK